MSTTSRSLCAALTVAMVGLAHARADDRPLGPDELASIQEATRELAREVEYLQDLVAETSDKKERGLYRQADAVLADIEGFQTVLKAKTSRKSLDKAFHEVDRKVHELLKGVLDLGPKQRLLQRSAARIGAADDQLHHALSAGDASEGKAKQLLERQTRALSAAARQLDKTAAYSLGAVPGRGVLVGDLHKLADAAEQFQKELNSGKDSPQLRKDFAAVNQAWERAVRGLRDLKSGENSHLLRAASYFDRLHERLHRLLGVEGKRPQLTIRT